MIRFFNNNDIDKKLWDNIILSSKNPLIYACSTYLDAVFPQWGALADDDFKAVMPVFPSAKFGIHYLQQPIYVQQSGIFFLHQTEFHRSEDFLTAVPSKFKFIDLHLNYKNLPPKGIRVWKEKRINQIIRLNQPYQILRERYSESHRKNIRRSEKYNFSLIENKDFNDFLRFKKENRALYTESLDLLKRIYERLNHHIRIFAVADNYGEIHALAFFLYWNNTLTWLSSASSSVSKENKAMFFLVDSLIKKYADSQNILDFAGSSLPGVWYFNNGFGAVDMVYYHLKINRLPLIIRWLKN